MRIITSNIKRYIENSTGGEIQFIFVLVLLLIIVLEKNAIKSTSMSTITNQHSQKARMRDPYKAEANSRYQV